MKTFPKVDKKIPIPPRINSWVDYLESLKVGDSFLVDSKKEALKTIVSAHRAKVKITTRKTKRGRLGGVCYRVWRIG